MSGRTPKQREPTLETTLLYRQDDHLTSFEATVVSVDPVERTLVLDATAFYPGGGHQHCDQGRIGKDRRNFVVVTETRRDPSGAVIHCWSAGEGSLAVGQRVRGSVHEPRRLHHMQLHTAQHALSRFAADRYGSQTGRADFSPRGGLVVIEPELSWTEALLLEDDLCQLIREDRAVSRRIDDEGCSLVSIDGLDESTCAGTHVTSTAEIGLFKITSLEGKVLRYEAGAAAMRSAVRIAGHGQEAARLLGLERTRELVATVEGLLADRERAEQQLEKWKSETTRRSVASARRTVRERDDGVPVLSVDLTHLAAGDAREILKKDLAAAGEIWIGLAERGNVMVSSGSEHVDAQAVVREFAERWGVRGGGNPRFAQGGPVPDDIGSPLEQVAEQVLNNPARAAS